MTELTDLTVKDKKTKKIIVKFPSLTNREVLEKENEYLGCSFKYYIYAKGGD